MTPPPGPISPIVHSPPVRHVLTEGVVVVVVDVVVIVVVVVVEGVVCWVGFLGGVVGVARVVEAAGGFVVVVVEGRELETHRS